MGKKIANNSEKDFFPFYKIRTKDEKIIPFLPNKAQEHYKENKTTRDIILKARQLGFSTLIQLEHLDECMKEEAISCLTVADTEKKAISLFDKVRTAIDRFEPKEFMDMYEIDVYSRSEVKFKKNLSKIKAGTAGAGVGDTLSRLHISEFALMTKIKQDEVLYRTSQAVPEDGYIVIESTARGDDKFAELYREAKDGKNDYTPHFYAWFWDEMYTMSYPKIQNWKELYIDHAKEYSLCLDPIADYKISENQFMWYAHKVFELKNEIKREFPINDDECFEGSAPTVFDSLTLNQMRPKEVIEKWENGQFLVWKLPELSRRYAVICDCAEGQIESDYSTICVFDLVSGELCAEFMGKIDPVTHARMAVSICERYNLAFLVPERNHHGHSFINTVRNELYYPSLYRDEEDRDKFGFLSNLKTKYEYILGPKGLRESLINGTITINSERGIKQLKRYVRLDNGGFRGESKRNDNDDLVTSYGIFCIIRENLLYKFRGII